MIKKMVKKSKNIILIKKRSTVEISDVDGWIFDIRYLVNGRENYYAQIIKSDIPTRIESLERDGFVKASEMKRRI